MGGISYYHVFDSSKRALTICKTQSGFAALHKQFVDSGVLLRICRIQVMGDRESLEKSTKPCPFRKGMLTT